jgi:hypothetical protein
MENKINIAELLKDCPKGMELYSPLCGDCKLYDANDYNIRIEASNKDTLICLYHDGRYCANGEIMLFPKGKTTWEGFQRPFKDGDILFVKSVYSWVLVYKESKNNENLYKYVAIHDNYNHTYIVYDNSPLCCKEDVSEIRLATEEEKQKLFDVIKENGYKWNAETKTLEKISEPKFKVGDRITDKNKFIYRITEITDKGYKLHDLKTTFITFEEADLYFVKVVDVFDINTLKSFDKVLVRDSDKDIWCASFFSHIWKDKYFCVDTWHNQCIPYEVNKELLGTTNNPKEYGSE